MHLMSDRWMPSARVTSRRSDQPFASLSALGLNGSHMCSGPHQGISGEYMRF
jgi:hypothetical protein